MLLVLCGCFLMFSFTSLSAFMLCAPSRPPLSSLHISESLSLSLLLGAARFAAVGRMVPADEAPG